MTYEEIRQKLKTEEKHDFGSLCQLVALLRSPEGCPWDREQSHESIRTNLIEETYEAVEAIDKSDPVLLREELGDVLLQVVFHARIEEEAGRGGMDGVIAGVVDKMIYRHPHVFGDVTVDGSGQVLENWDNLKAKEKKRDSLHGTLAAVPKQYPALLRAEKVLKKAKKANAAPSGKSLAALAEAAEAADGEERDRLLAELIWEAVLAGGRDADFEKRLQWLTDGFIDTAPEEET